MPTITVPADATNYSLYARLKLVRATETPNFLSTCSLQVQTNATNDSLKVGDRNMTSTDFSEEILAGDSVPLREDGPTILSENYVRNDGTNTINVNVKYTAL